MCLHPLATPHQRDAEPHGSQPSYAHRAALTLHSSACQLRNSPEHISPVQNPFFWSLKDFIHLYQIQLWSKNATALKMHSEGHVVALASRRDALLALFSSQARRFMSDALVRQHQALDQLKSEQVKKADRFSAIFCASQQHFGPTVCSVGEKGKHSRERDRAELQHCQPMGREWKGCPLQPLVLAATISLCPGCCTADIAPASSPLCSA